MDEIEAGAPHAFYPTATFTGYNLSRCILCGKPPEDERHRRENLAPTGTSHLPPYPPGEGGPVTDEERGEWGGQREGAGRPKRNAVKLKLGLSEEELEILDAYVERHGLANRSEGLRRAINVHMRRSL